MVARLCVDDCAGLSVGDSYSDRLSKAIRALAECIVLKRIVAQAGLLPQSKVAVQFDLCPIEHDTPGVRVDYDPVAQWPL